MAPEKVREVLASALKAPELGSPSAPIKMVIFQDIKCGMCKSFFKNTFAQLKKDYVDSGKVKMEFREFPLGLAPFEVALAESAKCANEQSKYEPYLMTLYDNFKTLDLNKLGTYAKQSGLDKKAFETCVKSKKYAEQVKKDVALGEQLNVDGTPVFFIDGVEVPGAGPIEKYRAVIDQQLQIEGRG